MKNNANAAAELVQQAIRETGEDAALYNARRYLAAALNELLHTHKKRVKRDNNIKLEQERERINKLRFEDSQKKELRTENAKWRLKMLDDLLKATLGESNQSGSVKK